MIIGSVIGNILVITAVLKSPNMRKVRLEHNVNEYNAIKAKVCLFLTNHDAISILVFQNTKKN